MKSHQWNFLFSSLKLFFLFLQNLMWQKILEFKTFFKNPCQKANKDLHLQMDIFCNLKIYYGKTSYGKRSSNEKHLQKFIPKGKKRIYIYKWIVFAISSFPMIDEIT